MRLLRDILGGIKTRKVLGSLDMEINHLQIDSRKISKGDLFIAIKGTQLDGHDFISMAIEAGAGTIVCEQLPDSIKNNICYIEVESASKSLGLIASAFYGHPARNLVVTGVTGTNGKTSIATFLYEIFEALGIPSGLISTVNTIIHKEISDATHTTPDAISIHGMLSRMVEAGCSHVFMEVSSHALVQDRVAGLLFKGGIYTNLTHDHLDYHGTFDNYIKAKKKFFDALPAEAFALVNTDDRNARVMIQNTLAKISTYGLKKVNEFNARIIERNLEATYLKIDETEVWVPFIGDFNVYNLLAAYAASNLLGLGKEEVLRIISQLKLVPGRFETIKSRDGKLAIVDYAHTPDALLNVLSAINKISEKNSRTITVVGAGGDRDKLKRPAMAKIGIENSHQLILTSDNPRGEDPIKIIQDMIQGIPDEYKEKTLSIVDRREAIKAACMIAQPGDIILIAGKGHETYQEVSGRRYHFDDREEVRKIFKEPEITN